VRCARARTSSGTGQPLTFMRCTVTSPRRSGHSQARCDAAEHRSTASRPSTQARCSASWTRRSGLCEGARSALRATLIQDSRVRTDSPCGTPLELILGVCTGYSAGISAPAIITSFTLPGALPAGHQAPVFRPHDSQRATRRLGLSGPSSDRQTVQLSACKPARPFLDGGLTLVAQARMLRPLFCTAF